MSERHKLSLAEVESMEVAPGAASRQLQGWIPPLASEAEIRDALEKAFDYRGDVTITLKSGEQIQAYVFDRRTGPTLAESHVKYFAPDGADKRRISYADIARLEFTGKDCAAGKHWEDWVRKHQERKAAGEKGIALHPESLD